MKMSFLIAGLALLASLGAGCGGVQMDTAPAGDPNRVVTGTVELGDQAALPADAEVTIRVVDEAHSTYKNPNAVLGEPTATAAISLPPQVVGVQRIQHVQGSSIPFSVKFYASDEELSTGLKLEARLSYGGKVRAFNVESYAVNTANVGESRRIYVNFVR